MYYVYILYSKTIQKYYSGQTSNLLLRLQEHNSGLTAGNKYGIPWILLGFVNAESRSEAMILERKIKRKRNKKMA